MELDVEKKARFESRLKELLQEGDAIAGDWVGIEFGEFSKENIQIHKWCASMELLLEAILSADSLLVEDVKTVLKKAKKPHELFEKVMGVAKAVEECCRAGDLDCRFMRMTKEGNMGSDKLLEMQ